MLDSRDEKYAESEREKERPTEDNFVDQKPKKLNLTKKYEKTERKLNQRNHKRVQEFCKCAKGTHKRK